MAPPGTPGSKPAKRPHGATVAEICDGVPKLADAPSGVYACGALLYYITEMPPETVGKLFGTLEIVKSGIGDDSRR